MKGSKKPPVFIISVLACLGLAACKNTVMEKWWDKPVQSNVNTRTVTFNSNGGSSVDAQTVNHGSMAAEPKAPVKEGYAFDGWYKDNGAFNDKWDFDNEPVTGDITLYAGWNPIMYTVRYDKNAATATGTMEDSTHIYDEGKALSANSYTYTGCLFMGWNIEANGSGTNYSDGETVKNLSVAAGAVVTLYARWNNNQYTVTFDADGGSPAPQPQTCVSHGNTVTEPSAMIKTGYAFDRWYTDSARTVPAVFPITVTGTITLYARWIADQAFTVTFEEIADGAPFLTDITIFRSREPATAILEVDNPSQYSSIEWYYNNILLESGASLTLDSSDIRYNMIGPKLLSVEVEKDGIPYSTTVVFTVAE